MSDAAPVQHRQQHRLFGLAAGVRWIAGPVGRPREIGDGSAGAGTPLGGRAEPSQTGALRARHRSGEVVGDVEERLPRRRGVDDRGGQDRPQRMPTLCGVHPVSVPHERQGVAHPGLVAEALRQRRKVLVPGPQAVLQQVYGPAVGVAHLAALERVQEIPDEKVLDRVVQAVPTGEKRSRTAWRARRTRA
ncbi:MAG: hypothetical protein LC808_03305 [Actinobacteria bacterium]|nr:hypothetical protein [Actinomycetota bacterium]